MNTGSLQAAGLDLLCAAPHGVSSLQDQQRAPRDSVRESQNIRNELARSDMGTRYLIPGQSIRRPLQMRLLCASRVYRVAASTVSPPEAHDGSISGHNF